MDVEQLERSEIRRKKILVSALFLLSLVFAFIFAYWMGAFGIGPVRAVYVNYDFAGGLDRGSPVRLAGIKVGRVTDITFVGTPTVIKLKVEVNSAAFPQITQDAKFYINLAGLIGERYVEVVPGTGPAATNGFQFRGIDPPRIDQLISQGYGIFGDLRAMFNENKGDIKEILTTLNDLSKNMNKLVGSASGEQKQHLNTILANFAGMSGDLRIVLASLRSGVSYAEQNGARESWNHLRSSLTKVDAIGVQDIRKLMLEDGVKVNFSTHKVEPASR